MTSPPRPSRSESKAAATDAAARDIIEHEAKLKSEKTARLRAERLHSESALDEALSESFPASDPVEIGHSEHAGSPKKKTTSLKPATKR